MWASVFVAYDLCYYFSHRYGHEWRILWASHVVHHQSEEFNLSTALRQTSTGWLNGGCYLPLYVLGVPVELMISVGSLNLIYQFLGTHGTRAPLGCVGMGAGDAVQSSRTSR